MGSYLNAYDLLAEVRKGINEYSTAYVQGTDVTGAFDNADIIKKINDAQDFLYHALLIRKPDLFYKSVALTGVASVYTVPADFYRLLRVEDSSGLTLRQISLTDKKRPTESGSVRYFYQVGKTYVLDKLTATDVLTFYYISRCRKLDTGMASAGAATSITLATTARKEVSYYNGMLLENITKDWVDTISAYATTRVATITATAAASDYYGMISELPEDFHSLIGPKAILLMKDTHKALSPPTETEIKNFNEAMTAAFQSFFGPEIPDPKALSFPTGNYRNAYSLLAEVRKGLGEYSQAHVQGVDSTGVYDNADILKKINDAQEFLYNSLLNRKPDLFYKSVALTGVASVYTPPADFYRLRRIEDLNGLKLTRIDLDDKKRVLDQGTGWFYYQIGNTFVLDRDSATDILTVYYISRCRKLDAGLASAGGAKSITLATTARKEADYYNSMKIENINKDWNDTISDYSAARVATLAAETAAALDFYGLVSELPEEFHDLIGPKALLLMKEAPGSPNPPTVTEINNFNESLAEAFLAFFGSFNSDQDAMELFY